MILEESTFYSALIEQLEAIVDIVWEPARTFERINKGLGSLAPVVIFSVSMAIIGWLSIGPMLQVLQRTQTEMSPEQYRKGIELIRGYKIVFVSLTPFVLVMKWAFIAGLLFLTCLVMDRIADFKKLFRLVVYASVFQLLQTVTSYAVVLIRSRTANTIAELQPALGLNLVISDVSQPMWVFLSTINLFDFWFFWVLCCGIMKLYSLSWQRAIWAILPIWGSSTGIQVAAAFLGGIGQQ